MAIALPVLAARLRSPRLAGEPVAMPISGDTGFVRPPLALDVS